VQKGISSDEFFGRAQFDPSQQNEAKSRLQGFEGATSISSNAYFGRPEDENNGEDYGDLETAAKDIVRKLGITAGDDLDNVTQLIGEGASRLQGESFLVLIMLVTPADMHRRIAYVPKRLVRRQWNGWT